MVIAVLRCSGGVLRHAQQRRTLHRKHLDLVRILTGGGATPGSTLWLDVPHPMAYSVAGRPALIVASEGLRRQLPETPSRPSSSTSGPIYAADIT